MAWKWKAEVDGYLEIGKVTAGCEGFFFQVSSLLFPQEGRCFMENYEKYSTIYRAYRQ